MAAWKRRLANALPWLTAAWVLVQLLALRLPLLSAFFFDTAHADVQGIDFYSLPKAWLNLAAGRSLYGTFDPPAYGPHFTWYLAHPLLALLLGWPLSRLAPGDSYGVWVLLSIVVFGACAFLFARETGDPLLRRLFALLFLGSFPGFLTLWVGNVQPLLVLGLSMLLVGVWRTFGNRPGAGLLLAGLLLCLFTKPVVFVMLPLLLLLPDTRRTAVLALAVYVPVSLLCLAVPALNPEGIGFGRIAWLLGHPSYVQNTMDIYANGLRLTPDMRDNSVHWFNLLAQSGFRLQHVDVYSLPVFLDGLLGTRTPSWIYLLPTALVLLLSILVATLRDREVRSGAALLLLSAASLAYFLTYPTVWEYQYTAMLPVAATLLLMQPGPWLRRRAWRWCVGLACCAWLPSLYCLSGSATPDTAVLALARLDRVVPVAALFGVLVWQVGRKAMVDVGLPLRPNRSTPATVPHKPTIPAPG